MNETIKVGERGVSQRAQRRGLSLRKARSSADARGPVGYWLVVPGTTSIVAGGDNGLSLENVVTWLSSSGEY
jgi:hypothetical protein